MAYIEATQIEEIKARNDIESVVSGYVSLKRAGSNMVGLCPFHSEKGPSFTVFSSSQNFYCFGCGAGGDVVTFIRKIENLDYPSAIEFLAKRAGITIQRGKDEEMSARRKEKTLQMNKLAAKYYHEKLMSPEGAEALAYLKKRGFSNSLIKHFGMGFAPNDFSGLTTLLRQNGFKDSEMADAFLCGISKKTGKPYDYFINRVIIPIISLAGDVIAFGGRVMDDSLPKYLNSSDTPAFKKSRNLFALNFAKSLGEKQLILCEGYMDVIALHGAGFTNAVATLGTAITSDQARLMKRFADKVIICYDADAAGQNAAYKAFRLLGEAGIECRIVKVENAKDPDEYIKKFGADAFKNLMEASRSEFDFRLDAILREHSILVTDEKIKAIDKTVSLIAEFPGASQREVYIHKASELFGIPPESLRRDIERSISRKERQRQKDEFKSIVTATSGYSDKVNPDAVKNPRAAKAEDAIIGILLLYPEYVKQLKNEGKLPGPEVFATQLGKKVYTLILQLAEGGEFSDSALGEYLSVEEMERLEKLKLERRRVSNNTPELLADCLQTLKAATRSKERDLDDILREKRNKKKN